MMSTLNNGLSTRRRSLRQHSTRKSTLAEETVTVDQDPINDEFPDSISQEAAIR